MQGLARHLEIFCGTIPAVRRSFKYTGAAAWCGIAQTWECDLFVLVLKIGKDRALAVSAYSVHVASLGLCTSARILWYGVYELRCLRILGDNFWYKSSDIIRASSDIRRVAPTAYQETSYLRELCFSPYIACFGSSAAKRYEDDARKKTDNANDDQYFDK